MRTAVAQYTRLMQYVTVVLHSYYINDLQVNSYGTSRVMCDAAELMAVRPTLHSYCINDLRVNSHGTSRVMCNAAVLMAERPTEVVDGMSNLLRALY